MEIIIDIDDETPIFTQLIDQVKSAVVSGELSPGFQLPSIRQLANDLEINQNTVAKAYKLLERDRVFVAKGYKGTFIHPEAMRNCQVNLNEKAHSILQQSISSLRDSGLTDSEIRIAFSKLMKESR